MSGQNRQQTMKQQMQSSSSPSSSSGYKFPVGIRNFFYFAFVWSTVSNFLMITGIWTFSNDNADTVFVTLSVGIPLVAIAFLAILDNS